MEPVYYKDFSPLKSFSLNITKEICGKISEAALHIEVRGNKLKLDLKNPKVRPDQSNIVQKISDISPETVNYLKINGNHIKPDTTLWSIEFGNDSHTITVSCSSIDGLPKEGWKNPDFSIM